MTKPLFSFWMLAGLFFLTICLLLAYNGDGGVELVILTASMAGSCITAAFLVPLADDALAINERTARQLVEQVVADYRVIRERDALLMEANKRIVEQDKTINELRQATLRRLGMEARKP